MLRIFGSVSVMALALAAVAPAHATVTFGSEQATSNASAYTNYGDPSTYASGFGTSSKSLSSFGTSLTATSSAQADSYGDDGMVSATANALEQTAATFASPSSGTIDLAGITSATVNDATSTAEAYSEGQSSTYTFSIDTASTFDLNYVYSESFTDPYFSNSIYLGNTSSGAIVYSLSPSGSNTSGSLTLMLDPGMYSFNVYTQIGDDAYASGGANAFGTHEELYTFNISAAPEPASWALMTLGVGMVGLTLRSVRRRAAVVAA